MTLLGNLHLAHSELPSGPMCARWQLRRWLYRLTRSLRSLHLEDTSRLQQRTQLCRHCQQRKLSLCQMLGSISCRSSDHNPLHTQTKRRHNPHSEDTHRCLADTATLRMIRGTHRPAHSALGSVATCEHSCSCRWTSCLRSLHLEDTSPLQQRTQLWRHRQHHKVSLSQPRASVSCRSSDHNPLHTQTKRRHNPHSEDTHRCLADTATLRMIRGTHRPAHSALGSVATCEHSCSCRWTSCLRSLRSRRPRSPAQSRTRDCSSWSDPPPRRLTA